MTNKGTTINADIIFNCVGGKPRSKFMEKYLPQTLDDKKFIKVNEFLQVEGYEKIFCGGDVCNIPEEKCADRALQHADVIAENMKRLVKNKKLKKYKTAHPSIFFLI